MRFLTVPFVVIVVLAASLFCINEHTASAATFGAQIEASDDAADAMKDVATWQLDNEHTSLVCAASHFGLSYIYGRFNECAGAVEMNFEKPESTKFRFRIDAKSVDTNDANRDASLRGPKGFDTDQYKSITFESTVVKVKDKPTRGGKTTRTFLVTGNLSLHGETRQVELPLELLAVGKGSDGELRCGFISKFVVFRSDFGMDEMTNTVGDSVAVTFCFQAIREKVVEKKKVLDDVLKADARSRFDIGAEEDKDEANRLQELFGDRFDGSEKEESDPSPGQLQIEK